LKLWAAAAVRAGALSPVAAETSPTLMWNAMDSMAQPSMSSSAGMPCR
jgi:hypothetical protein